MISNAVKILTAIGVASILTIFYQDVANNINVNYPALKIEGNDNYCSSHWERDEGLWEFGTTPSYFLADDASQENQLPFELMSGRSILVIGGSTSRDLAADFMQSVLPLKLQQNVSNQWAATGNPHPGFELFPATGKKYHFQKQYQTDIMQPLLDVGWRFEHLNPTLKTSGCSGCRSSCSNIDYVATFQNISYEFSWKPEILSPSDEVTFHQRYCKKQYDIVYLGRGLHDAAFYPPLEMTPDSIRSRFLTLAKLLKCFPKETLIIFRSPYMTTTGSEQGRVEDVALILADLFADFHFDSESGEIRSVLVNGLLLSSSDGAPKTYDGHHYDSRMARSIWRVIYTVYSAFLGKHHNNLIPNFTWEDIIHDKFKDCGFGRSATIG